MNIPKKVTIEITAEGVNLEVLDGQGTRLFTQKSTMVSRGRMRESGEDIWDSELADHWDDMAEVIDDISGGPFEIASKLYEYKEEFGG